jgi:CBS domain containing-hemolysin-like protein
VRTGRARFLYAAQMLSRLDIRAIVLATLAVIGIDFLVGSVLMSAYAGEQIASATDDAARKAVLAALAANSEYLRAVLILGTASTVLGGFLVARIARSIPYFNGLAYGVVAVVLNLLPTQGLPTWFKVVGIGLTVPAALLGAYFGKRPLSK